jgi:hypothetical protein
MEGKNDSSSCQVLGRLKLVDLSSLVYKKNRRQTNN